MNACLQNRKMYLRFFFSISEFTSQGSYRKPLEMLLNLVDKHWTGERSLHHNNNFLCELEFGLGNLISDYRTLSLIMNLFLIISIFGSSSGSPDPLYDGKWYFQPWGWGQDLKTGSWCAELSSSYTRGRAQDWSAKSLWSAGRFP